MFPKMQVEIEELRQLIRAAFPSVPFRGAVTDGCRCDECAELETVLRCRSWGELARETIENQFGALPLLSDAAYSAFLPAWLMQSLDRLDDLSDNIREWTLYDLAIYLDGTADAEERSRQIQRVRRRRERLTRGQVHAVAAFLGFVRENCGISEWGRESIDLALTRIWRRTE